MYVVGFFFCFFCGWGGWGGCTCVSSVLHLINELEFISHAANASNWAGTAVKVLECPSESTTVTFTCVRKMKDLSDLYVPLHGNELQMLPCSNLNRRRHSDTTVLDLIPAPACTHDQMHDWLLVGFPNCK